MISIKSKIIWFCIYCIVITPIGIILRITRIELIKRKFDKESNTYWLNQTSSNTWQVKATDNLFSERKIKSEKLGGLFSFKKRKIIKKKRYKKNPTDDIYPLF